MLLSVPFGAYRLPSLSIRKYKLTLAQCQMLAGWGGVREGLFNSMTSHARKIANNPFTPKLKNVLKLFSEHCLNFLQRRSCLTQWLLISNVALFKYKVAMENLPT